MADIYEIIFIVHLVLVFGITLVKLFNVISVGQTYETGTSIILFISFVIAWFLGLVVSFVMMDKFYSQMFAFSNLFFLINVIFFIIELFYYFGKTAKDNIQSYTPQR